MSGSGKRYALQRPTADGSEVVALGVEVYERMVGDVWLGVDGAPLHCVDTTRVPGIVEGLVRGQDRETYVVRSDDARCVAVAAVPSVDSLRAGLKTPPAATR